MEEEGVDVGMLADDQLNALIDDPRDERDLPRKSIQLWDQQFRLGLLDEVDRLPLNQLGVEEDLLGYQDHDETNLLLEETWPQIINQRTMRVIRYAIRDSVDRAIKEVLMRP